MSLENARDSYVDLLMIKAKKEDESKKKLTTTSSSRRERIVDNLLNGNTEKRQTSFRPSKKSEPQSNINKVNNITYEPVQVDDNEDDINWLIWEMTTSNPWRDNVSTMEERVTSITACERIFTVPEVYDELQCGLVGDLSSLVLRNNSSDTNGINGGEEGPCSNILHCFNPWKQQQVQTPNDAFQDYNPQDQQQPQDLIQRSSMAVSNYLNLPPSKRKVYIPSMFNTTTTNNNNSNNDHKKANLKGCMKRPSSIPPSSTTSPNTNSTPSNSKSKYKVHFAEIKRILRIRKFTPKEQLQVWYQKVDFDYFKNEMTLLIQQDGASRELAQVWLEAQACESSRRGSSSDEGSGSDNEEDKQQQHHHNSKPTRKHNRDDSNSSTKWWHNYDHSRRGLERYASPGQARQILASYKIAVKKVLGEQQRQRLLGCLFFIPGVVKNDVEKIAEIYHSYTSWSRDLALAAGASDADAVRTNFDENKRHTREYYLLKQIVASGNLVHKHMPQFMLPKCIKPKGFIDESKSLHSTIQMRPRGLGKRSVSVAGKEAREEMSRLDNNDVIAGPVSPMLASLQVNSADHDMMGSPKSTGSVGSRASSRGSEVVKKSMAEKAKNYPFQH